MRGGEKAEEEKGVEVSGRFFMVGFNYKQPAWWGGYARSTFRGSLKQHLFRVRRGFNDLLYLFRTSLPPFSLIICILAQ